MAYARVDYSRALQVWQEAARNFRDIDSIVHPGQLLSGSWQPGGKPVIRLSAAANKIVPLW